MSREKLKQQLTMQNTFLDCAKATTQAMADREKKAEMHVMDSLTGAVSHEPSAQISQSAR